MKTTTKTVASAPEQFKASADTGYDYLNVSVTIVTYDRVGGGRGSRKYSYKVSASRVLDWAAYCYANPAVCLCRAGGQDLFSRQVSA